MMIVCVCYISDVIVAWIKTTEVSSADIKDKIREIANPLMNNEPPHGK